ncbi:VOC family protein [Luteipulveratus flavus]|uniref:VOC family protein n=1 Tax=Luteipulveratus flavus TaxID=3031728 RepID=A0ABT6CA18_9MICO|nr:VOC family protein [Luteipulveratus sp. YIM 133296]MDF8265581.1 VOC family protein [Luteipulveratus sp. YIM 133296]
MKTAVSHVTFDCRDAYAQAAFWCQVFDVPVDAEDHPGDPEAIVRVEGGPTLLFVQVPDDKAVKNRVHLDLRPGIPRDEEVERLRSLGATQRDDQRRPDGTGWVVMTDPEGNEFCVERSRAERDAGPRPAEG